MLYIFIYIVIRTSNSIHMSVNIRGHVKHMSSPVAIVAPEGFGWHQSIERDQSKENQLIYSVAAQVVVVGTKVVHLKGFFHSGINIGSGAVASPDRCCFDPKGRFVISNFDQ